MDGKEGLLEPDVRDHEVVPQDEKQSLQEFSFGIFLVHQYIRIHRLSDAFDMVGKLA